MILLEMCVCFGGSNYFKVLSAPRILNVWYALWILFDVNVFGVLYSGDIIDACKSGTEIRLTPYLSWRIMEYAGTRV